MNRLPAAVLTVVLVAASTAATTAVILWPRSVEARPVNARLAMVDPAAVIAKL